MFKSLFAVALHAATYNVQAAYADAELDAMLELDAQWFDQANQEPTHGYGSSRGQSFGDSGSQFGYENDGYDSSQGYSGSDRYGSSSGYSGDSYARPSGYGGDSHRRSSDYQDPTSSIKRHEIESGFGSSSISSHNDQHRPSSPSYGQYQRGRSSSPGYAQLERGRSSSPSYGQSERSRSSSPGYGQAQRGYGQNSWSKNLDRYGKESGYGNKSWGESKQIGLKKIPHQRYLHNRPSRNHRSGYDSLDSNDRQIVRGPSYGHQNQGHSHGDIFHSHDGSSKSHDHGHQHQQYQGVIGHQQRHHQPRNQQYKVDYWNDVEELPRNSAGYDSYKRTGHIAPKKVQGYQYVKNPNFVTAQDYYTPVNLKNRTSKDKVLRDEVEANKLWQEIDPIIRRASIKALNNGKDHVPKSAGSHLYQSLVGETKRCPWTGAKL